MARARQAGHSQQLTEGQVQLDVDITSVHVGMDQAIACGLLVNELVCNSLKHGFADARAGTVHVGLQAAHSATVATDAKTPWGCSWPMT